MLFFGGVLEKVPPTANIEKNPAKAIKNIHDNVTGKNHGCVDCENLDNHEFCGVFLKITTSLIKYANINSVGYVINISYPSAIVKPFGLNIKTNRIIIHNKKRNKIKKLYDVKSLSKVKDGGSIFIVLILYNIKFTYFPLQFFLRDIRDKVPLN